MISSISPRLCRGEPGQRPGLTERKTRWDPQALIALQVGIAYIELMLPKSEIATHFEIIKEGLEDCLAYTRGEITLRTTTLPMPPPAISRRKLIALRRRFKLSQSVFAATLNVPIQLVQSWEQGTRTPEHGDLRLLNLLLQKPELLDQIFNEPQRRKPTRRVRAKSAA
jgi:putative transcriptional regulator